LSASGRFSFASSAFTSSFFASPESRRSASAEGARRSLSIGTRPGFGVIAIVDLDKDRRPRPGPVL